MAGLQLMGAFEGGGGGGVSQESGGYTPISASPGLRAVANTLVRRFYICWDS